MVSAGITRSYNSSLDVRLSDRKYPSASDDSVASRQNSPSASRAGSVSRAAGGDWAEAIAAATAATMARTSHRIRSSRVLRRLGVSSSSGAPSFGTNAAEGVLDMRTPLSPRSRRRTEDYI